jgi:FtsH-binding integral membrane protein
VGRFILVGVLGVLSGRRREVDIFIGRNDFGVAITVVGGILFC